MGQEEWSPGRLLQVSGRYWETCTLHAAVKVDLFTLLGDDSLNGEEIAGRLGGDPRGVSMLLNALAVMGLLSRSDGKYTNTPAARSFLSRDSERYLGHMIRHHHHLVESWARLDQAVLSGEPIRERPTFALQEFLESFLLGMHTLAMQLAPQVVEAVDLSGRNRLLDLGGGPGTYAIHFCLKNPGLRATVFDLPTSQPTAEKTIDGFGLADRVDFQGGTYLADTLPGGYDVAWLSHILHGEGPEGCRVIIDKAVSALQPGGMVVVHEFVLDDRSGGPLFPALFSLNMLLGTANGQAYSEKEIRDMLAGAGVRGIHRLPFRGPNDSGLIVGTR
jgi:DNA-binding MarR family transcriptional regulator